MEEVARYREVLEQKRGVFEKARKKLEKYGREGNRDINETVSNVLDLLNRGIVVLAKNDNLGLEGILAEHNQRTYRYFALNMPREVRNVAGMIAAMLTPDTLQEMKKEARRGRYIVIDGIRGGIYGFDGNGNLVKAEKIRSLPVNLNYIVVIGPEYSVILSKERLYSDVWRDLGLTKALVPEVRKLLPGKRVIIVPKWPPEKERYIKVETDAGTIRIEKQESIPTGKVNIERNFSGTPSKILKIESERAVYYPGYVVEGKEPLFKRLRRVFRKLVKHLR